MASATAPTAEVTSTAKRASSRARRRPDVYTTSPFTSSKRKRDEREAPDADGDVNMDGEEESEEDDEPEDDEPAEEEVWEKAKKARKPKSSAPKKPAQKKPKANGVTLPIRAATKGPAKKRAPKKVKVADSADAEAAGGLYAEVFAHDKTIEQVVAEWLEAFAEHESLALSDVINFVLKAAGTNGKVTEHDTEDPDNASNRITDLQEEFQATEPTDYPMIAKGKGLNANAFKKTVSSFFDILIQTIAAKGWLTTNSELIENVQVWLSSLTSATSRAFRHTSTVCALSVIGALCEVTKGFAQKATDDQSLAESERKKKNANKGRIKDFEQKAKEGHEQLEVGRELLRDWFDTIFIHRYRDIDANIRRDCVEALGDWIAILPDQFFDGNHLRYLGWLLSDENPSVRAEVLKQLHRFYGDSNKLGGLKTFSERFRPRLVEIGTSDADINVRISGLELLDLLRENDLLEPDDHDLVGRLVFHDDSKIRKAIAGFFAASVKDLYDSKVEELGGEEALEDALPDAGDSNFEAPRIAWLKYKALAEMLQAYNQDEDLPAQIERSKIDGSLILRAGGCDSRFTCAVDALYEEIKEIQEWQAVAGYLLFDHSRGRANGVGDDPLSQLKHESTLQEAEEIILLEVLNASVNRSLSDLAERITGSKSKLSKKQKEDLEEEQDEAVRHLTDLIPKLLRKFGDVPHTAAAVLRIGNVLALPALQGLRHDSAASAALLDDLRKQFMSHGTDEVLAPATGAISHAIAYGELDESALEKVSSLWEDVVSNLAELLDVKTITVRGCSQQEELLALANNLLRIIRLAPTSNPTEPLEDTSVAAKDETIGKEYNGAIDFIIDLTKRAQHSSGPAPDPEEAALEDIVATRAAEAALFYFQWKITAIVNTVKAGQEVEYENLAALAERRDAFVENLAGIMDGRRAGDEVSPKAARHLLDLYITSAVLRTQQPRPGVSDDYTVLVIDLNADHQKAIMKIFAAAEREYAKLSNRKLEIPVSESKDDDDDVDADPIDDDPLSEDEDEDEETQQTQTQPSRQRDAKLSKPVLAEERLCQLTTKLVWAILAGIIDDKAARKRLERNKNRLGPNFKEVLAFLDVGKGGGAKGKAAKKAPAAAKKAAPPSGAAKAGKGKSNPKSNAIVAEDEDEDEIEDEDMEEGDADVLKRRELDVEDDEEPRDDDMVNGAPADDDEESVLGD
ncbi:hypothetical protein M409DRAFT_28578 [Zasmidium cellare ATCC 36951]|uniref:SCD domain-containing protein n=1 Tax=Zasmidium cellare ATCC 36951 TaxID=1080233 RepID=A0A6A6C529_ZASCE|nr:uncharacterized protein M409DRAFT_28578 [Zasmidium cellare ATCC 36951]KAF2160972.1 hypothetical protein M409DRAFT_28578 [Zasmidium cellare ATCC 36951]